MSNQGSTQITNQLHPQAIADYYLSKGYHIVFKDSETLQMVKGKKFSCLAGVLLFLFIIPALPLYLIFYLSRSDRKINIRRYSNNAVGVINQNGNETVFDHMPTSREMNRAILTSGDIFWRWFLIIWLGLSFILEIVFFVYVVSNIY